MNILIQNIEGAWEQGTPVKGQLYRLEKDGHVYLESYYNSPEEEGTQDGSTN